MSDVKFMQGSGDHPPATVRGSFPAKYECRAGGIA
jgi:hypothetical protein